MSPGRPFLILIILILPFSLSYMLSLILKNKKDGIWKHWIKERSRTDLGDDKPELLTCKWTNAILNGLYFSLLSAFHIGYRDINVGGLISKIQPNEYRLQASGWVWLHGQPLAQIVAGGGVYYYHNDHLGTPQKMTDGSGTVVWAADYLPFGQADVIVGAVGNNLRFKGQYYDSETGLHYNYHRYYDPNLGRYLRADPIGLAGGVNLYAYVFNNPINFTDRYGENCDCDSSPWNILPKCESLKSRGFKYKDQDEAFRQVVKETKIKNLTKHSKKKVSGEIKRHINIRYKGEKIASLISMKCCDDSSGHPEPKEIWAIVNRWY